MVLVSVTAFAGRASAQGYPAPGGIYAPFTDCPLHDPIMRQAAPGFAMGCIKSITASGTFTINGLPVQITHPVTVQFGTYSDLDASGNQVFHVVPPQDGETLVTEPEVIPGGLLVLVCSSTDPRVQRLCRTATSAGHTDLTLEVQLAGPITNFSPLAESPFTLPVKVKLENPLLGGQCYIGSNDDPIVLQPLFNPVGTLGFEGDPDPERFPNVAVLSINHRLHAHRRHLQRAGRERLRPRRSARRRDQRDARTAVAVGQQSSRVERQRRAVRR
jgi:hypothetical protein